MCIVNHDVCLIHISKCSDAECAICATNNATVIVGAKDNLLPMFKTDGYIVLLISILEWLPGSIIKDVAVLVDLNQRCAFVGCSSAKH